ncbi:MAG: hypothetical protein LLG14_02595 [Nocardiaceae bacterium]|nr:hypothetical protein [Nocardiaceae bacterium]
MESIVAVPALRFGEVVHDIGDLVLVGMLTGMWQSFERDVAHGMALDAADGSLISRGDIESALTAFRYERSLISAADLRDWLAKRRVPVTDLVAVIRRRLLRERGEVAVYHAPPAEQVIAAMRAEAICGGVLKQCLGVLRDWHAGAAALCPDQVRREDDPHGSARIEGVASLALTNAASGLSSLGREAVRRRISFLDSLRSKHDAACSLALLDTDIVERLHERRLEWTSVRGLELGFAREGAAREACIQVALEGKTFADFGAVALEPPVKRVMVLGAAPRDIQAELLAAAPGGVVGPWQNGGLWRVLQLDDRSSPTLADETVVERARAELRRELLDRHAAGKATEMTAL